MPTRARGRFTVSRWPEIERRAFPPLEVSKTAGCPIPARSLRKSLPCFAEAPSEAEGEVEGVGFHKSVRHGICRVLDFGWRSGLPLR
jgi:hypothetical protein